jgi:hypothetical protein
VKLADMDGGDIPNRHAHGIALFHRIVDVDAVDMYFECRH